LRETSLHKDKSSTKSTNVNEDGEIQTFQLRVFIQSPDASKIFNTGLLKQNISHLNH